MNANMVSKVKFFKFINSYFLLWLRDHNLILPYNIVSAFSSNLPLLKDSKLISNTSLAYQYKHFFTIEDSPYKIIIYSIANSLCKRSQLIHLYDKNNIHIIYIAIGK